jgi:hypothetical protein
LVGLDGHAKLVDFGVANATAHSDLGSEDKIKGKFGYMSPEQARAEKLDRRSDVFALGIVLFELLTGERLFHGDNAAHSLELVKRGPIPNPSEHNPKLSPQLVAIVERALQRAPSQRYQTARELADALERCLVEERVLVSHASVGQLVRRVLGSRIETQRQALREALTASDGELAAGLVPEHPAAPDHSRPSVSNMGFPVSPSEPPTASSLSSKSATPKPQSLELAPRRKASFAPFAAAIGGIAAAGAAVWLANHQVAKPLPASGANLSVPAETARSKPSPADYTPEPGPWGLKIDAIPLATDEDEGAAKARAAHGAKSTEDAGRTDKPSSPDSAASAEKPAGSAEEKPSDSPPTVEEPERRAPPATKLPPLDQRPPLNRTSALNALGAAATQVSSCKQEGGPHGAGTASVTFSTDGPVSSVRVSAPFAGTAVGSCVQALFKSAHVPAFSGSPVTLSKSFRVPG